MHRLKYLLIIFVASLFWFAPKANAYDTNDFTIKSFNSNYYLSRDKSLVSHMKVEETIVAVFPDYDQNHGIIRALPETYNNTPLHLNIASVTDENGVAYDYTTSKSNNNTVLKVGSADAYVHGDKTYKITYSLQNVIRIFNNDELYWDANGDQWPQIFGEANVTIHLDDNLASSLNGQKKCFTGAYGQNLQNCTISQSKTAVETTITASAKDLSPYSTLTFVVGFNSGTFKINAVDQFAVKHRAQLFAVFGSIAPIIYVFWLYKRWRKFGRDPSGKGVIIPQYVPLKDLNVLCSDVVLNEKLESKAVSSLIVALAVSKYIRIYEIPKKGLMGKTDYELELLKTDSSLDEDENKVIEMFFGDNPAPLTKVKLSDLKNKLHSSIDELSKSIPARLFKEGYFQNDPNNVKKKYALRGSIAIFLGFIGAQFLFHVSAYAGVFCIGILISGVITLIVANYMPARTLKGVEARDYLLGLRDYMQLAEADRIKFLQSPQGVKQFGDPTKPSNQVKLFEKLLPYAMLFGIEKDWAKQFEDLYKQPPDWYSGNIGTFNAVYLASSLGNFSGASAASFSAPSSSSSSGFGGGGFSGGGGGGGGGGGW